MCVESHRPAEALAFLTQTQCFSVDPSTKVITPLSMIRLFTIQLCSSDLLSTPLLFRAASYFLRWGTPSALHCSKEQRIRHGLDNTRAVTETGNKVETGNVPYDDIKISSVHPISNTSLRPPPLIHCPTLHFHHVSIRCTQCVARIQRQP